MPADKNYYKSRISFIENKFAFKEIFSETYKNKKKVLAYINRAIDWRNQFDDIMKKRISKESSQKIIEQSDKELDKLFKEFDNQTKFSPANFQFPTHKKKLSGKLDLHKKFIENLENDYNKFLDYISEDIKLSKKYLFKNNKLYNKEQIKNLIPRQLNMDEEVLLTEVARSYSSLIEFLCFVVSEINYQKLPEDNKLESMHALTQQFVMWRTGNN